MKILFTFLLLIFTNFAYADSSPITDYSELSYVCTNDGEGLAISASLEKVWLVDQGIEKQGLELKVTDFRLARCRHCVSIDAELTFFGTKVYYQINVNPDNNDRGKVKAEVIIADEEDSTSANFDCIVQ